MAQAEEPKKEQAGHPPAPGSTTGGMGSVGQRTNEPTLEEKVGAEKHMEETNGAHTAPDQDAPHRPRRIEHPTPETSVPDDEAQLRGTEDTRSGTGATNRHTASNGGDAALEAASTTPLPDGTTVSKDTEAK